jgi:DNA modification methylase
MFFPDAVNTDGPIDPHRGKIFLYQGDCREVLRRLEPNSVHTCVTSPPYYALRDYGNDKQIGRETTPQAYVDTMVAVFREVKRVLRDDGTLWLNIGDSYCNQATAGSGLKPKDLLGIPWMTALALRADGWYLRQDNIWHKRSHTPESVHDRTTRNHEYIFQLTKSARYFYDYTAIEEAGDIEAGTLAAKGSEERAKHANGRPPEYAVYTGKRNRRSVWRIGNEPFEGTHYAAFPRALPAICIKAGSSAKGCCPECGASWIRQVEPSDRYARDLGTDWYDFSEDDARDTKGKGAGRNAAHRSYNNRNVQFRETVTTGWKASCDHGLEPVPCTVLDPFGGSGTTGMVASELGRNAVLIELSDEYTKIIKHRCDAWYPVQSMTTPTIKRRAVQS